MKRQYSKSGVLIINKPAGLTSRDVVNKISDVLNTKKVGHTGTLDPLATGVLIITIGKYTKLSDYLMCEYKEYSVEMKLGYVTDTLDSSGEIVKTSDLCVKKREIQNVINSFKGKYLQEVPLYSAVKINGKRLYKYAYNNEKIELPKREVEIKQISDISINSNSIKFKCEVSKGTYIRSLVRDIGEKLGTYATMTSLVRIKQAGFTLNDAYSLDDIEKGNFQILGIRDIFKDIKIIETDNILYKEVSNGVIKYYDFDDEYILFIHDGKEVSLYKKSDNNKYKMYLKLE